MQKFKIVAIAKTKKNLVKVGTTKEDAEWYFLSDAVVKFLGGYNNLLGKEIKTFDAVWSKELKGQLISRVNTAVSNTAVSTDTKTTKPQKETPNVEKKPVESVVEKKAEVKTNNITVNDLDKTLTAQTIQALISQINLENIEEAIKKIYNTYKNLG